MPAPVGKAPACPATHAHFILDLLCHVVRVFRMSSVASLLGGDNKLPSFSRTIKEKRDAYVRRLNEIYENNVAKVRMLLFPEAGVEAVPSVYFLYLSAADAIPGLPAVAPQAHIDIIRGYGKFIADPEPTIEVDGQKYTAPHILIATGGRPVVPPDCEVPGEYPHSASREQVMRLQEASCSYPW